MIQYLSLTAMARKNNECWRPSLDLAMAAAASHLIYLFVRGRASLAVILQDNGSHVFNSGPAFLDTTEQQNSSSRTCTAKANRQERHWVRISIQLVSSLVGSNCILSVLKIRFE